MEALLRARFEHDVVGRDGSHFQGWVRYTHAGGIDEPLAVWKLNSDGIVPHLSWRGTFEAGSDILTGALLEGGGDTPWIWPARYTDINLAPELRMPNATPTRWLGSLIEGQVDLNGLAYRRNRYYDPSTGRFTQEDPIGLAGGLNLYGFADGDPVNFSDPFGLCARETINVRQIEDCTRWLASSSSGEKLGLVALGAGAVGLGGAVIAGTQSLVALSSLPMLSRGPGREMFRSAVGMLQRMPGSARVDAFRNFAQQINAHDKSWSASQLRATNGTVFSGERGEAIVFDKIGQMFRGNIGDAAAFARQKGGELLIDFGRLKKVN